MPGADAPAHGRPMLGIRDLTWSAASFGSHYSPPAAWVRVRVRVRVRPRVRPRVRVGVPAAWAEGRARWQSCRRRPPDL
eukprot:scaffold118892_cov42-Phaeocystis_antarctica.AAC.1